MSHRIPSEFPKVWPWNPAFRGHLSKALTLREDPFATWHLVLTGGILFILFGLISFIIPARIFGYSLLLGIAICVTSYPFVRYANKKQKRECAKVIEDTIRQASVETRRLEVKASSCVTCNDVDDQVNMEVMSSSNARHYTPNWGWVRQKLPHRDGFSCCLCGRAVQLADSVAHHITAFSEGGRTEFGNLATICVDCHSVIHPWLNPRLNLFWIRLERGRVYCWKCKSRLDTSRANIVICSDCGWLYHIDDAACGCNYPERRVL
jgi:5-methylcytosine-specific restriction endonuclease McrA